MLCPKSPVIEVWRRRQFVNRNQTLRHDLACAGKVARESGINRSLTISCTVTKHWHFGYTYDATFPRFIQRLRATAPGRLCVLRFESTYYKMKTDYSFKLVTAIVFAGVIVAFFSPNHAAPRAENVATEVPHVTAAALSE